MKIIGLHLPYSLLIPIAIGRKTVGLFFLLMLSFSCGKDKVIQLPEINHSEITEISDVSAAYLFYDETKADSVELNRKNLISSTNWLVNVDKRLTLKQAIPHIKFLQEKKNASSHKNENSKNYFTCSDLSRKNLGFVEFTDVVYHEESSLDYLKKISDLKLFELNLITINFSPKNKVIVFNSKSKNLHINTNRNDFLDIIKKSDSIKSKIYLNFHKDLSFNDYINIKHKLQNLNLNYIKIPKDEFISNY